MTTLIKYNLNGEKAGEITVNDSFLEKTTNQQLIKDYIIAIRSNLRQWSACKKSRSDVKHTTKKPHPQKGQGRARQGCTVAPQHRGGGLAFPPKPKFDQHVKINKKERRQAISSLIVDKIKKNKLIVLDSIKMESPKTKKVTNLLNALEVTSRVLFLGESSFNEKEEPSVSVKHKNFTKSISNIKKTEFLLAPNVNGYELVKAGTVIITEDGLDELIKWLS